MIRAVLFDYGRVLYGPVWPHRKVWGLAKELRRHSVRTGVLSNIFVVAGWFLRLMGGYRGFNPLILSFKEKTAKPHARIYEIAIKRLGVKPEEIIFVDNNEENIAAARKLGMKVVLAKNSDQIVEEVKKILLQENKLKF